MHTTVTARQVRWERFVRSGLNQPFHDEHFASVALGGIQAQILPAAGLALANRTPHFTQARLDTALHGERTLVKLWGQRGTLHLYATDDWPLMHAALQLYPTWWARQAAKGEFDLKEFETAVQSVGDALRTQGTLRRSDLRGQELAVSAHLLSSWGGVFAELVRRGDACHAGRDSAEGVFAHREWWAPDLVWDPPGTIEANVELSRRFLAAYGPATVQDVAYWRGGRVKEATDWVQALAPELEEVSALSESGRAVNMLVARNAPVAGNAPDRGSAPDPGDWPVRLLYRFDPLLLGHKDKTWLVDEARYKTVWQAAGHIEGTVLVDGRIVGTWNYRRRANHLDITVAAFRALKPPERSAIKREAAIKAEYFALTPGKIAIARS